MKKHFLRKILLPLAVAFIFCACNDPIFFTMSHEVKPTDPLIEGAPANFAVFNDAMYTASGSRLYRYTGTSSLGAGNWDRSTPPPGGRILQIASTSEFLYALVLENQNSNRTAIKRFNNTLWQNIEDSSTQTRTINYIFAADDTLFVGAATGNSHVILYVDKDEADITSAIKELKLDGDIVAAGEIRGAVFDGTNYYICTRNRGVYKVNDFSQEALQLPNPMDDEGEERRINYTGIISLDDNNNTILLIARNGEIFTINNSVIESKGNLGGHIRLATGALAIWIDKEDSSRRLLLAGRQDSLVYTIDSGYTYGYLELELDENGIKTDATFKEPGMPGLSSVFDNDRYKSTIGKHPVNFIFQAPNGIDDNMTLFASTQKSGVWSYRERGGVPQWNAEE